jgi:hypothetical protein
VSTNGETNFARIIEEHLELKRLEDTLGGHEPELEPSKVLAWPGEDTDPPVDPEDTLWGRSRDFDWGD